MNGMMKKGVAELIGTYLAGARRVRQRRTGGGFPRRRHRLARRGAGFRPDRRHHGLCHRPYFRLPFEPGGHGRPLGGRALSRRATSRLMSSRRCWARLRRPITVYIIASGTAGFALGPNGLAVNGVGELSPGGYSMMAGVVTEIVMTAFFLLIIMGSTHSRAPAGFAPLAIGLGLTLIHLISIPVTNTSVNPARSTGPALIVGGMALQQLWIFWVAPIVGGDHRRRPLPLAFGRRSAGARHQGKSLCLSLLGPGGFASSGSMLGQCRGNRYRPGSHGQD